MVTNFSGDFVALVTVINEPVPCLSRPRISDHPEAFQAVREQGTRPIGNPTKYHMHRTFSAALTLCVDVWSPCIGTSHFVRLRFLSWTRACHVEGRDWRKKKRKHGSRTGQKSAPPLPSLHRDHDVGHRLILYHSATSHIKRS
jgi:hypothetical protein